MMKFARLPSRLSLLALALLSSSLAMAQTPGWYGGLGVGPSRSNIDEDRLSNSLLGSGLTSTSIDEDTHDTGYKLFGGYQFGPFFALEGGYFDLGRFGFKATTVPVGTLTGDIRLQGLNLDAIGRVPFTEKFSAFGRAGLTYVDTADQFRGTGAVTVADPSPSKREGGFKYGVGLQYELTPTMALRAEAERYRVNDAVGNLGDVDLVSVGLILRFGSKPQEPAAAPAPVAVAAQPEPVAAPAPVPPPPRVLKRVVIAVDNDFDFDKVSLSASGKRTLDGFARDLRGLNYERITVIGNTDRFGTESYNMKLSERRAVSVRDYLVLSGGVPAGKIVATGAGETDHRTVPSDCVGERASARMIECLQPDRRVDIEVHGTR